ncbi:MAG: CarD family transcriptional regulator [Firmicutes bacterium]|nr:CarD family transcriptional regulator [Bacillota bacterium]
MFAIGDDVVYAMHGAGKVKAIEEKKILGEVKSYYILHITNGNMEIMVPTKGESAGLRSIVDAETISQVGNTLAAESTPMDDNWNRRNRENMEKLKTGDVFEVAEVIRNLLRIDRVKRLSAGEKKLLQNARQILASEIAVVNNIQLDEAQEYIDSRV